MKWGIEVEGLYKGIPMIFCGAADVASPEGLNRVVDAANQRRVRFIYVSDNENVLDYTQLGLDLADFTITLDCTKVKGDRPANINLMLRDPSFDEIQKLDINDQIKFERDRTVYVWGMGDVVKTVPEDFAGDIEL